ncbi:uncharacterized protein CLUP02_07981 [Colletotrichum lupini]|uniref:Uncharacterized protein n=1 Tax=Colletotrichum lupini TaxID=145971 RepID=A0A9Q8WG70_9PEZI|nr:uncharacterized protein CLUP02_07981 [Colletotrichum lupini]UQC82493.1 hypothetical protein CLUP02_07981 [Colletotrichum lupini]
MKDISFRNPHLPFTEGGIPTNRKAPHSSPTLTRKTDSANPGALKWAPPQGLIKKPTHKAPDPSAGRPETRRDGLGQDSAGPNQCPWAPPRPPQTPGSRLSEESRARLGASVFSWQVNETLIYIPIGTYDKEGHSLQHSSQTLVLETPQIKNPVPAPWHTFGRVAVVSFRRIEKFGQTIRRLISPRHNPLENPSVRDRSTFAHRQKFFLAFRHAGVETCCAVKIGVIRAPGPAEPTGGVRKKACREVPRQDAARRRRWRRQESPQSTPAIWAGLCSSYRNNKHGAPDDARIRVVVREPRIIEAVGRKELKISHRVNQDAIGTSHWHHLDGALQLLSGKADGVLQRGVRGNSMMQTNHAAIIHVACRCKVEVGGHPLKMDCFRCSPSRPVADLAVAGWLAVTHGRTGDLSENLSRTKPGWFLQDASSGTRSSTCRTMRANAGSHDEPLEVAALLQCRVGVYILNILAAISYAHANLTEAGFRTGVWLAILPSKDTARQMLQTTCSSSVKTKGYQSDRRIAGPTQQYVLPRAQLQKSYI